MRALTIIAFVIAYLILFVVCIAFDAASFLP